MAICLSLCGNGKFSVIQAIKGKKSLFKNAPSYGAQIENEQTLEKKYAEMKLRDKGKIYSRFLKADKKC
jgi:hypothetical protein